MTDNPDDFAEFVPSLRRRIVVSDEPKSAPTWLLSFTDVVALMLTFFVLLYAMSEPVVKKWERKIGITNSSTGSYSGESGKSGTDEGPNIDRVDYQGAENLDYLQAVLEEILEKHNVASSTKIEKKGNNLALIFSPKNENKNQKITSFLKELSPTLDALDNKIIIVGYDSSKDGFLSLQQLGKTIKRFGYKKPVPLAVKSDERMDGSYLSLYIHPYTSKRYE